MGYNLKNNLETDVKYILRYKKDGNSKKSLNTLKEISKTEFDINVEFKEDRFVFKDIYAYQQYKNLQNEKFEDSYMGTPNLTKSLIINLKTKKSKYEDKSLDYQTKIKKNDLENNESYIRKSSEIYYILEKLQEDLEYYYDICREKKMNEDFKEFVSFVFQAYNDSIDRNQETLEILKTGEDFNKQRFDKCFFDETFTIALQRRKSLLDMKLGVENIKELNLSRDRIQSRVDLLERTIKDIKLMEEEVNHRYINFEKFIKERTGKSLYNLRRNNIQKYLADDIWISKKTNESLKDEILFLESKKTKNNLSEKDELRLIEINKEIEKNINEHLFYLKVQQKNDKELKTTRGYLESLSNTYYNGKLSNTHYRSLGEHEEFKEKASYEYNFDSEELFNKIEENLEKYKNFQYNRNEIVDIEAQAIVDSEKNTDELFIKERERRKEFTDALVGSIIDTENIIKTKDINEVLSHLKFLSETDETYSRYLLNLNSMSGNLKVLRGINYAVNAANEELLGKDYRTLTKKELFDRIKDLKDDFKSDGFTINAKVSQDIFSYNNPCLSVLDMLGNGIVHTTGELISKDPSKPWIESDKIVELNESQLEKLSIIHNEELEININLRKILNEKINKSDYLNLHEKTFIKDYSIIKATFTKDFIEKYKSIKDEDTKNKVIKDLNLYNFEHVKEIVDFIVYNNPDKSETLNSIILKIAENDKELGEKFFIPFKEYDVSVYELFAHMKNSNMLSFEDIRDFEEDFLSRRDFNTEEIVEELKSTLDVSSINKINEEIEKLDKAILAEKVNSYKNYCAILDTFRNTDFSPEVIKKFEMLFPEENKLTIHRFDKLIDLRNSLYEELEAETNKANQETISAKIVFLENSILGYDENEPTMINNSKDSTLRELSDTHKSDIEKLIVKINKINEGYEAEKQKIEEQIVDLENGKITLDDGSKRNLTEGKDNKEEELKKLKERLLKNEADYKEILRDSFEKISSPFLSELTSSELVFDKVKAKEELINNNDGKMHLIFEELKNVFNSKNEISVEKNEITQEQIAIFAASLIYENGIENMRAILLKGIENKETKLLGLNLSGENEEDKITRILNSKNKNDILSNKIENTFGYLSEDDKLKVLESFEKMVNLMEVEYPNMSFNTYASFLKEYINTNENIIIADSQKDSALLNTIVESGISSVLINDIELPRPNKLNELFSVLNKYNESDISTEDKRKESNIELLNGLSQVFYNRELSNLKVSELENLKEVLSNITNKNNEITKDSFSIVPNIGEGEELANIIANYKDNNKVLCVSLYPSNIYLDEFSKNKDRVIEHYSDAVTQSTLTKLKNNKINISDSFEVLDSEIERIVTEREIKEGINISQQMEFVRTIQCDKIDYTIKYKELSDREKGYINEAITKMVENNFEIDLLKNQTFVMENPEHLKSIFEHYKFEDFGSSLKLEKPEVSEALYNYIKDNYNENLLLILNDNLTDKQKNDFINSLKSMDKETSELVIVLEKEFKLLENEVINAIKHKIDFSDNFNSLSEEDKVSRNKIIKDLIENDFDINLLKNQTFIMENPEHLKSIFEHYEFNDFKDALNLKKPEVSEALYDYIKDNYSKKLLLELQKDLDAEQLKGFRSNLKSMGKEGEELAGNFTPFKCEIIKDINNGIDYTKKYKTLSYKEKDSQDRAITDLIEDNIDIDLLKKQKFIVESPEHLKSIFEHYKLKDYKDSLNLEKPEVSEALYDYIKDNYSKKLLSEIQVKLTDKQLEDFEKNLLKMDKKDDFTKDLIKTLQAENTRIYDTKEQKMPKEQVYKEKEPSKEQLEFLETCKEIEKECLDSKKNLNVEKVIEIYNSLDEGSQEHDNKRRHINAYIFSQDISINNKKLELSSPPQIVEDISSVFSENDVNDINIKKQTEPKNIYYEKVVSPDMDVKYNYEAENVSGEFLK